MNDEKVINDTLKYIVENWHLEARQEPDSLFYFLEYIDQLENGKKSYVIGRKGMGKTAISEYLYNKKSYNIFSERLTFKNFPFNYFYTLKNSEYTKPNQYISIWKYLIYNSICKKMALNENIDSSISSKLKKLYPTNDTMVKKSLSNMLKQWTANSFGIEILGNGINVSTSSPEGLNWIEKIDILQNIILEYGDDSYYYILIDELDEDYRDFTSEEEKKIYFNLLSSLFKAVQDIKNIFRDSKSKIRPVVFLRSDIYALIKDSDKNKWSDFKIDISWTPDKLYKMLCHRLYISSQKQLVETDSWNCIFSSDPVFMGNKGQNKMKIYDYIVRSTHWRPRDFIHYISECAKLSLEKKEKNISPVTVKKVDREFSEYLRNEIVDEIFAEVTDIDIVLAILSNIRKQTFSPSEFINRYKDSTTESDSRAKEVLLKLFEYGVIGNQPSMKGQQIFKHQYPNTLFNFNENIIIHRGLYKSLQIF